MKKREIMLDFTSLLDVTLIVIFFFVIFSHFDTLENRAKTEEKVNELETSIEEANEREAEAAELVLQLEEDIEVVRQTDERRAENLEAIVEFGNGKNLKLILVEQDENLVLRACNNEKVIEEVLVEDLTMERLAEVMQKAGYLAEDTIFCDFVYDGTLPGTHGARKKVTMELQEARKTYKYLYYSETDLSFGEE